MGKRYCPYCMSTVKDGETCANCGLTEGVYTPRPHHLPLGTILNNRYLVGRVLGEGGFGITYIGCDLNLELKVAIKEYFPIDRVYRLSKTSLQVSGYSHAVEKYHSGKEKFLWEARIMARLDKQQNIVSVRDFFEENDTAYIVMEYLEGITLKEMVRQRGGRIPARELLHMLEPLFSALTAIHEMGLLHRDISPDNLMLENGRIKLLDFGCSKDSAAQSETTTIALKQGFAPIEQYQYKGQGPWTDVYALSATIYYCLTGKAPQSAVDRISEDELVPPGKLGVDLTAGQEEALLHGLNVKAKDRFKSVEELYAALYTNEKFTQVSNESTPVPDESIIAPDEPTPVQNESIAAEKESIPASDKPIIVPNEPISASNEVIPASDPDLNQIVRNDNDNPVTDVPLIDNRTEVFDSVRKSSGEELSLSETDDEGTEALAEGGTKKAFDILKQRLILMTRQRRNLMILAGSAVLLVAAVCIVCAIVLPRNAEKTIASREDDRGPGSFGEGDSGSGGVSGEEIQPGNQSGSESSDDTPQEFETVETLFANATVLEVYTEEEFQRLMDDDTVPAIRIPEASSIGESDISIRSTGTAGTVVITKPVLVDENTLVVFWNMVTVRGENACLWVEGAVEVGCILQTEDGGRIVADNHDNYFGVDILWLEKNSDIRILSGDYPNYKDLIIGGKDTLFGNAVSVSDEATLLQAVSKNQSVIVCNDITIETELTFHVPIMIEEGVTVDMRGSGSIIGDGNDSFLWNEGRIQGGVIQTNSETRSVNYGEISADTLMMNGIFLNLGDITVTNGDIHRFDGKSSLCNMGTLRCQAEAGASGAQFGPDLLNYGVVTFFSPGDTLFVCASEIENHGEIRVENGTVHLLSYLLNMSEGQILVCDDATLYNRGVIEIYSGNLQCEPAGNLINVEGAVYYLFGRPEDTLNGWIHISNIDPVPDSVCAVSNADELTDALQNPEVDKVYLTGEIRWNEQTALTLTKEVEISGGARLLMKEGSELILDGCYLENAGYMKVDDLTLTHGGSLRNYYGTVELYSVESAIKLGNERGEGGYSGTDCLLNYGSILNGCKIELYDSSLMIQKGMLLLDEPVIQIRDHAYFANMGEIQWGNGCSVEISGEGLFHNLLRQDWPNKLTMRITEGGTFCNFGSLVIQNGVLSVEQGGEFQSSENITLGNSLSVSNDGNFMIYGGRDNLVQGYFENHGILRIENGIGLVIDAPRGAANTACLNNQGEVRINDQNGYVKAVNGEFTGNEPTYESLE